MGEGVGQLGASGPPGADSSALSKCSAGSVEGKYLESTTGGQQHSTVAPARLAELSLAYPETSLFCFRKQSAVRQFCLIVSHSRTFENFILFCILANCVTLALSSNREGFDQTRLGRTLNNTEYIWVAIFSLEALLKIISMGFILAPGTYLRDGWNWIDFVVVALGYVDIFTSGNMTAVRTVRALRPLRAITRIRGMKVLVTTMIESMPMLLDVVVLCAFTFFIWGIVAVQLLAGVLRNRCGEPDFTHATVNPSTTLALVDGKVALSNVSYVVSDDAAGTLCSGPLASDTSWYQVAGVSTVASSGTRGGGYVCPTGSYCTAFANPNYGMTSFDNILWAWLTIFQCITLESWTDVMYAVSDAVSWWVWPLFVGLVIFGSFFLVSLALAVIFLQFSAESNEARVQKQEQKKRDREQAEDETKQREGKEDLDKQHRASSTGSSDSDDEEAYGGKGGGGGDGKANHIGAPNGSGGGKGMANATGVVPLAMSEGLSSRELPPVKSVTLTDEEVEALHPARRAVYRMAVSRPITILTTALILFNTVVMCINWYGMPVSVERVTNYINYALTMYFLLELLIKLIGFGVKKYFKDGMNIFDFIVVVVSVVEMVIDLLPNVTGLGPLSVLRMLRLLRIFRLARHWRQLYSIIYAIMRSVLSTTYLMLLMLLFIFIAALVGMQLFGYKLIFCDYVEGARPVCPLGQQMWGQCPNHLHCYLPCQDEQYESWVEAPGSNYNGLAYCERFCANAAAASAADSYATSLQVEAAGGCEYLAMVGKSQVPRANFDNVLWALFTVFQLLTGENWNNVMYDGMRTTSPWCSVYYVIVELLGTYLVFNLFIAILLDNFQGAVESGELPSSDGSRNDESSAEVGLKPSDSMPPPPQGPWLGKQLQQPESDSVCGSDGSLKSAADGGRVSDVVPVGDGWTRGLGEGVGGAPILTRAFKMDARRVELGTCASQRSSNCDTFGCEGERAEVLGITNGADSVWQQQPRLSPSPADGPLDECFVATGTEYVGQQAGPDVLTAGRVFIPRVQPPGDEQSPTASGRGDEQDSSQPLSQLLTAAVGARESGPSMRRVVPLNGGSRPPSGLGGRIRPLSPVLQRQPQPTNGAASLKPDYFAMEESPAQTSIGFRISSSRFINDAGGGAAVVAHAADVARGPAPQTAVSKTSIGLEDASAPKDVRKALHAVMFKETDQMSSAFMLTRVAAAAQAGECIAFDDKTSAAGSRDKRDDNDDSVRHSYDGHPSNSLGSSSSMDSSNDWRDESTDGADRPRTKMLWFLGWASTSLHMIRHVDRHEHLSTLIQGRALLLLPPDHWMRWRAAWMVHSSRFESTILLFILASSVALALDTPSLDAHSRLASALRIMDYIFTGVFTVEALLKIVTLGFAFTGKHAYIRNGWNVLDLVIVLQAWALIVVEAAGLDENNLQMLRVLRTLRALRPLRAASRYEGLKVVVNALFAVLPSMANVALVCLLFYVVFAILAVNLFKGKLFNCIDANSGERIDPYYVLAPGQVLSRQWCEEGSQTISQSAYYSALNVSMPEYNISTLWVNPRANFDNVGTAMLSLFQVATLELWLDIAFSAVDASGEGKQPTWNHSPVALLFFIFFITVCSFFILNLFVGVTLEKVAEMQRAQTASSVFVTQQQRNWVEVQKLLLRTTLQSQQTRPDEPPWRMALFDVVISPTFGNVIMGVICANVVFMALVHADMSEQWQAAMSYSNLLFTCVFVVEALMKLVAFGLRGYFRDGWNSFDCFVAVVSVVSVVLDFSNLRNLSFMPVLRVLRVVRIIRLIRRARGVKRLLVTLLNSLPALSNVGCIMLLFFTVYGIIGMNMFGDMVYGDYLNNHANFDNFPNSMLVLMRVITGESWDGIMMDCMVTRDCVLVRNDINVTSSSTTITVSGGTYLSPSDPLLAHLPSDAINNKCAITPALAVIFFTTFVILCGFILLNLIIAVILENMMASDADEALPVSRSMVGRFVEIWGVVDSAASGTIHASKLPLVLGELEPPLGSKGLASRSAVQSVIMSVDIPVHPGNQVTFVETLHALAGRLAGTQLPDNEEELIINHYIKRLPGGSTTLPKYTAAHFHAALHVKAAVQGFLARHRMQEHERQSGTGLDEQQQQVQHIGKEEVKVGECQAAHGEPLPLPGSVTLLPRSSAFIS